MSAKSAVEAMLQHVVATKIVVSTRVMSRSSSANDDFGPSAVANSLTFQG